MAQGNLYAPLYNSLQARGRMSPLGAPGAIKPEKKKKGLGDKMASALGSMIDQAGQGDDQKRISQLMVRNEQLKEEELNWEGSSQWNQDNYEFEAFGREHSGHQREKEYQSNLNEIDQIKIGKQMDEPSTMESFINSFVRG